MGPHLLVQYFLSQTQPTPDERSVPLSEFYVLPLISKQQHPLLELTFSPDICPHQTLLVTWQFQAKGDSCCQRRELSSLVALQSAPFLLGQSCIYYIFPFSFAFTSHSSVKFSLGLLLYENAFTSFLPLCWGLQMDFGLQASHSLLITYPIDATSYHSAKGVSM